MTIQAFLTSGILERYALGMTSEEERLEVLEMVSQHEEIKAELAAIRQTLKGYVLSHQVNPPADLKDKVLEVANTKTTPTGKREVSSAARSTNHAMPKNREWHGPSSKMVAGLLGLALVAVSITAFSFFKDIENAKRTAQTAQQEVAEAKKQLAAEQENAAALQSKLDFYQDRNNRIFLLKGTQRAAGAKAIVYWNNTVKSGALDLPALPVLPSGQSAVLWASADGTVFKIGLLKPNEPDALTPLTFVENTDFFFVTEEEGPDVEKPNRAKVLMTAN